MLMFPDLNWSFSCKFANDLTETLFDSNSKKAEPITKNITKS